MYSSYTKSHEKVVVITAGNRNRKRLVPQGHFSFADHKCFSEHLTNEP